MSVAANLLVTSVGVQWTLRIFGLLAWAVCVPAACLIRQPKSAAAAVPQLQWYVPSINWPVHPLGKARGPKEEERTRIANYLGHRRSLPIGIAFENVNSFFCSSAVPSAASRSSSLPISSPSTLELYPRSVWRSLFWPCGTSHRQWDACSPDSSQMLCSVH